MLAYEKMGRAAAQNMFQSSASPAKSSQVEDACLRPQRPTVFWVDNTSLDGLAVYPSARAPAWHAEDPRLNPQLLQLKVLMWKVMRKINMAWWDTRELLPGWVNNTDLDGTVVWFSVRQLSLLKMSKLEPSSSVWIDMQIWSGCVLCERGLRSKERALLIFLGGGVPSLLHTCPTEQAFGKPLVLFIVCRYFWMGQCLCCSPGAFGVELFCIQRGRTGSRFLHKDVT